MSGLSGSINAELLVLNVELSIHTFIYRRFPLIPSFRDSKWWCHLMSTHFFCSCAMCGLRVGRRYGRVGRTYAGFRIAFWSK